jgi:U3 small nucleolar RNA-associated protein 12
MPLTKQYLRYEPAEAFGVICSRKTGAILYQKRDKGGTKKIYAVSPALEHVVIWDLKTGLKAAVFGGSTREVTCLRLQEGSSVLAVGYEDGPVKLWDLESHECHVTFSGHKSAVQCLAFDREGTRLVSGGKDTDVIVWDVVNESGLYRLKGHKGPVTSCLFLDDYNVLITCSKDTFVKLWDLHTQHCFQTIVDHRSEVWSGTLIRNGMRLITTSSDVELRVYDLTSSDSSKVAPVSCQLLGSIKRGSRSRPLCLAVDGEGLNMVVMNNEFSLDVFNISGDGEVEKKRKKRIKNLKKKAKEGGNEWVEGEVEHPIDDELPLVYTFNTSNKMRSCDILKTSPDTLQILISLYSNSLQLYNIDISNSTDTLIYSIELCGHRSDIRTVSISSDGTLIASGSSDMVKVWNTSSRVCLHTLPSGYAVTSCFVPGDRHLLVGVKSGDLLLYDISSGSLLESFPAHSLSIWSIDVSPNRRGFITGSADKDVKFWEFELTTDIANPGRKQLTAVHVKTLKMSEDVLCLKHSPNEKVLAVSLLDSTVKVFFVDTLKFFLSLYGHKLPVLCMDISHDSNLMVTGSADKNIRIWGLDYGDCHRSIFAHDESIMAIQFIPKTHLCFTVSKDKLLKCWDVDHFELIQTLKGHHSEVWSLAVSSDGNLVVTGSHDLSLRFWECTREPLVLSEERENASNIFLIMIIARAGERGGV